MDARLLSIAMAGWTIVAITARAVRAEERGPTLPDTAPLAIEGDIASLMVEGVDRFLLREIERSLDRRNARWRSDLSSPEAYEASVAPHRESLRRKLGLRDERVPFDAPEIVARLGESQAIARAETFDVFAVRWPAFGDVHGEGLLLVPRDRSPIADVVVLPDADELPEDLAGLGDALPAERQSARRLAESGCRVVVLSLIDRRLEPRRPPGRTSGGAELSTREFLYRPAFELGRTLVGYEVAKALASVDWLEKDHATNGARPVALAGYGEGAFVGLFAAALDPRIDAAIVSGCFDAREGMWDQPIDRNIFGLLEEFSDAELARLVFPRPLIVETCLGPELELPGRGGAPARLRSPALESATREIERAREAADSASFGRKPIHVVVGSDGRGPCGSEEALGKLLDALAPGTRLAPLGEAPRSIRAVDPESRRRRQIHEIDRHNQALLVESPYVRSEFLKNLDTSSIESFERSIAPYRERFRDEVIGRFDLERSPSSPRSRKSYEGEGWTGYEVVLDVFPDVMAYGILLLPDDAVAGDRRPVVVCQHGLEGRPQSIIGEKDHHYYKAFAAELAKRGFVTFAPQNLYIFGDRFRTLQRKSNAIGKTLFSTIIPQHEAIVEWLGSLPWVDPERIAFYGLSYGGKSAMRIPALVEEYCLSICSADFNEWVWKNASTRSPYSYVWTGEYEIFEFDLGSTFNYAEMAALIAPRPFMVERGHFDGVAPDEAVAYEYAKVRHLYQARLGIGDRTEIEFFVGPHSINGQGAFDFLHRHLSWPREEE
ncbi:MAG TPA: hypothetical protein VK116_11365 [Planctomycetota bacterium]|nr:hypothetical protein [Planctomycetota bacterium]